MNWLRVVQRLQTIAQAGLTYSENPFDRDRYQQLLRLAAEIGAERTRTPLENMEALLAAEKGYPTPKVDVRAVVPQGDKLLFVREVVDGHWSLPGGWADIGDSPAEVAVREVFEETGYRARAKKVLAVLDKAKHAHPPEFWYCYKLFILCELVSGEPATSHETTEIGFYPAGALPPLSLPRNTEAQVLRMFEHVAHPEWPTDFD